MTNAIWQRPLGVGDFLQIDRIFKNSAANLSRASAGGSWTVEVQFGDRDGRGGPERPSGEAMVDDVADQTGG